MKVSFDFDSTLSEKHVQKYAKLLISKGIDVWVCTSRQTSEENGNPEWNDDLFEVTDRLNIPRENIIFTGYRNKSEFLNDREFIWHLDDDVIELSFIKTDSDVTPISFYKNPLWRLECENTISAKKVNNINQ